MRTLSLTVLLVVALVTLVPSGAVAQHEVRVPPFSGTNYLNNIIMGDTLTGGARRDSNTVYVLTRGGAYLSNAVITNIGWPLQIKANDTTGNVSKPIVYLYLGATSQTLPGQFVSMRGNFTMKNVILDGYFEPDPTILLGLQGALFNTASAGLNLQLDSCILTNTNGNHVRTDQAPHLLKITNCIFANMGYLGKSNLGAGKGIDVRAGSVDSMIVVNNTFVNWQDRIIRHFSSTASIQYLRFEHNTCVNGMSYHGFLSLGRVGKKIIIQDNLLVDAFALGQDTDAVRQSEFTDSGEKDAFGFPRMTWVISNPNDTTQWVIKNNYFRVTPAGQSFFDSASILPIVANPALVAGSPLTYKINSRIGADSATAFRTHTADLPNTPALMTAFMKWYRRPQALPDSGAGKTKTVSAWKAKFDFDRRSYAYFRDTLNCAYSTGNAVYTEGTGGYPVGDLNWFPSKLTQWLADPVSSVQPGQGMVNSYELSQNYPNPFNPSTKIEFAIPKQSNVELRIFNVLGQEVATLVHESMAAGRHTVSFDAKNLASGLYFYRITAGQFTSVKKMMLLR